MKYPRLITVGEENSFAVEDLKSQAERVVNFILEKNNLSSKVQRDLIGLQSSIASGGKIDYLVSGNDIRYWHNIMGLNDVKKRKWNDKFHHGITISYFHRLILDKLRYFDILRDPYQNIKRDSFRSFIQNSKEKLSNQASLQIIIEGMLWGNKYDLIPPVICKDRVLLVDKINDFEIFLKKIKPKFIDIIADNYGEELFFDLLFIDYLFKNRLVKQIRYHVKNYPYNISDTTVEDFKWAIEYLLRSKSKNTIDLGKCISKLVEEGHLKINTYPFTTLGLDRRLALNVIKKQFKGSKLIISKGDFNYRKNIGWYYWKQTHNYSKAISYFPAPVLCLRTIKNEVLLGITSLKKIKKQNRYDKSWWKKGVGGMISFEYPHLKDSYLNSTVDTYWEGKI